ncbi:hypothetical protein Tco_0604964, partial [Tanacetum coccineum]
MIWIPASKTFPVTLDFLSSLGCRTNFPFLLKNFLKFLTAIAYSLSSLPDVKVSSSLDYFLAFVGNKGFSSLYCW